MSPFASRPISSRSQLSKIGMHIETITNSWIGCGTPSTPDGMTSCAPSPPNIATSSASGNPDHWRPQRPRLPYRDLPDVRPHDLQVRTRSFTISTMTSWATPRCRSASSVPGVVFTAASRSWSQASRLRVADGPGDRRQRRRWNMGWSTKLYHRQASRAGLAPCRSHHDAATHDPAPYHPDRTASVAAEDQQRPGRRLWYPDVRASRQKGAGARQGPYQIKSRVRSEGQEEQLRLACPFIEMGRREAVSPHIVAKQRDRGGERWSKRSGRHSARVEL